MTLLNGTLAIRDVRDVEAFAREVLETRLREWGATLSEDRREEALAYLIALAWELERSFNAELGISYSKYLFRMFRLRLVDWYRLTYGDARYGAKPVEPISPDSALLDQADPDEWAVGVVDQVWLEDLLETATLSERARGLLRDVAIPLVEGATYDQIASRLGMSKRWVARAMQELRAELLETTGAFTVGPAAQGGMT